MRFGDFDSYRHDCDEGPDAPEGYIPSEQALEHVFENERDAVQERVKADAALEWLKAGQPWLDLLNIVSRHDKEQLKEAIRQEIDGARRSDPERIAEPQPDYSNRSARLIPTSVLLLRTSPGQTASLN